jgi:hypothetical protein
MHYTHINTKNIPNISLQREKASTSHPPKEENRTILKQTTCQLTDPECALHDVFWKNRLGLRAIKPHTCTGTLNVYDFPEYVDNYCIACYRSGICSHKRGGFVWIADIQVLHGWFEANGARTTTEWASFAPVRQYGRKDGLSCCRLWPKSHSLRVACS